MSTETTSQFSRVLNQQNHEILVVVGSSTNVNQQHTYALITNQISDIAFEQSNSSLIWNCGLIYDDIGDVMLPNIAANNVSFAVLSITSDNELQEPTVMELTCVVDSVEVVNRSTNGTKYRLGFTQIEYSNLISNAVYATKKPTLCTDIIKSMMNKAKLKFEILDECDVKMDYITPSEYTLKESIDFIISNMTTPENGIFKLKFNTSKNQFELYSPKQAVNAAHDVNNADDVSTLLTKYVNGNNIFVFEDTNTPQSPKSDRILMRNFGEIADRTATENINEMRNIRAYTYNKKSRDVESKVISHKHMRDTLATSSNVLTKDFNNADTSFSELKFETPMSPQDHYHYNDTMHSVNDRSRLIQFDVDSELNRSDQDMMVIVTRPESKFDQRYGGVWIIQRIERHVGEALMVDRIYASRILDARFG